MNSKADLTKALLVLFCTLGFALPAFAAEMSVRIVDPPAAGSVNFELYDSANAFGDLRDPARAERFPLDGRQQYRIEEIPPGTYALVVYFDENGNGRLDKNFIGIPTEPLAFSNGYRPKGPPSYGRAVFTLTDDAPVHFDVTLQRPLGKRGRLGVGVGAIVQSSPYVGYDGSVVQVIPAISYTGERLQVYGPFVRFGLAGNDTVSLAATGRYRIGAYEEKDSVFLQGMGDRKDTFMAGLTVQFELPGGVELTAHYAHDVADAIGGGLAGVGIEKSVQLGIVRLTPGLGLNWLGADLSNHDFGVLPAQATPERPSYLPGDTVSVEAGMRIMIEITRDWLVILNASVESLDDKITDSPIVEKNYVVKGFAAINYAF